jgi:glycerol-1-phosphate dehydrogenase [NAD(P)+]
MLPSAQDARGLLKEVYAPFEPAQVDVEPEMVYDALVYAKEIRARYTVLQLLWDLNLLQVFASRVVPSAWWLEEVGFGETMKDM